MPVRRRLSTFTGFGYDKGKPLPVCALWVLVEPILRSVVIPSSLRVRALRAFGAEIGTGVLLRHDVRIHWPWKLRIGNDCWIGVGAWLLNLEPISIGDDVCISQGVLLCTGSHQADNPAFEFDNAPIRVEDGAWIAARATVLRGVTVGCDSVVGATALVVKDVEPGARVVAPRAEVRFA
ncbi:putative colanic acid biosynthesis acetyltransferase [Arsenicicoccus sp. MKL-02]|uniref:Putative colanic acid biosynthesis acetyltransferase n=1 Tax=Arsenicicoccus cauae TaxID=2663847 RepID=A0A6I3IEJ3_9MICO|nr:DapH/DapD/GlmU-related protein [Arsenicicoccus cauae]MTB72658.1 putative colanic acid biosynthesis acetyltransferase [Arsenicicoccus cauae]